MTRFDWNDLRYFLEVARVGTLSGAGRALGADHATVARRIGALEHALRQTLFHRSLAGYALTASGEQLLAHAEEMEGLAMRAAASAANPGAALAGLVRLTTPDGFGNFFLAGFLERFASTYPRLCLQFVPVQQIQAASQREGDVAVTLTSGGARFSSEKLTEYGLGLYASTGYLDASPALAAGEDLRGHRMVGYVEDLLISSELDYLSDVLPGLRANIQCASLSAQVAATRNGAGICVLPHFIARLFAELVPVLPGAVELRRTYWLNVAPGTARAPRVRAVIEFLRDAVEEFEFR